MRRAAELLADDETICFVRRVITRDENADEAHDTLSVDEFLAREAQAGFALSWQANGLHYGIPVSAHQDITDGKVVVANASRDKAPEIKRIFKRSVVIHITAASETLRQRLTARGREHADAIELRLARSLALEQGLSADIRVENYGILDVAVRQFVNALIALKPAQQAKRSER
jgi:ribose 1,5-bisphosphokinase